ncbi:MAG TPA: CocE/NonD family hydrolase [Patescibacteria group bacterium]|nr:CocE/NonD family hydrolase [Patescibacteria group bacterium]
MPILDAAVPPTDPDSDVLAELDAGLGLDVRRDVRVPARDGLTLSVNLFLPRGATERVPAILNTDPYRKDDWSASWDLTIAAYFAERGYAYSRLDVRGTGSSDGVALDEYTDAETLDGHDTVEWLAAQPWCTGAIGMWGLSYGGFTSIQVAATRPPHLRAIVPVQATDDRYTDDVHYVGGAMTVSELAQYAVSQVAMNALPALPSAWGDAWLARWRARLEATPVWLFRWAREQRDGPYWRVGSLAPDYGRIEAAVLQLAGWMDEYVDAALRIQANCAHAAGRRTIVGPWVHGHAHSAYPGPNIDWLHETVRWFDHWLKGADNGVEREPPLTWFHRDPTPPERFPARLNGAWRATRAWPVADAAGRLLHLGPGTLAGVASSGGVDTFAHRPTAGAAGGSLCWGAGHRPNGLAADLRLEADAGPAYTSAPLDEPLDILGVPVAVLHVAATQPVAHLVVRLGDVAPDGPIEQVSEGILNLTHRESHERPTPLEPGRWQQVRVPLRAAGYRFPAGHRVQLSVASAHWPVIWPAPGAGELSIRFGPDAPSRLELPLAPVGTHDVEPPRFKEAAPALASIGSDSAEPSRWDAVRDADAGTHAIDTHEGETSVLPDGRSTLYVGETLHMVASEREPGVGRFENSCEYRLDQSGRRIVVVADGTTVADATTFDWRAGIRVQLDGELFFQRDWHEAIPRDLT